MVSASTTTLLLLVVPIALFLLMRKGQSIIPGAGDKPNCNAATRWCTCPNGESWQFGLNSDCTDCSIECAKRMRTEAAGPFTSGFDPIGGATGSIPFESNLVQGTLQFPLSDKIAIPITSASADFEDPSLFDEFTHGFCQCDDYMCCYQAPYQPKRGDLRTETECDTIRYGDKVKACENAFEDFQNTVSDAGIDNNEWINAKVDEDKFFFELNEDRFGRNRHSDSRRYMNTFMAYANAGGRNYNQNLFKAYPALLYSDTDIQNKKTNAIHRLMGESRASRRLKDTRLRRKLLGY